MEDGSQASRACAVRKIDEGRKRGLTESVELFRCEPKLRSGTPGFESIPIECQQDLALTWFGKMPPRGSALCRPQPTLCERFGAPFGISPRVSASSRNP
jgi:hypothetical protein